MPQEGNVKAYLYLNAILYVLFAAGCSIAPGSTSSSIGFLDLSSGGKSEYLVVYGGLQLGLAIAFWLLARDSAYWKIGMLLSIALYAPIVVYRLITVARYWPVPSLTLATGTLELGLLIAALAIYRRH
jgi:hypothetical protein